MQSCPAPQATAQATTAFPARVTRLLPMLLLLVAGLITPVTAAAQSFLFDVPEPYQAVVEPLADNDIEGAEAVLQSLPADLQGTGDYYFLQGLLKMSELSDAGMFSAVRLSRGLKRDLEQALEADPDHELSHFGLIQFHRFAPGLIGGSQDQLDYHKRRLIELDSQLQFPAELPRVQMEEDEEAEIAIYQAWMAHSPSSFDAHYNYAARLIALARYQDAKQQLQATTAIAEPEQHAEIHYQQLRLAAEADDSIDQAYREEAYNTAVQLLVDETASLKARPGWLYLRLAQVALKLSQIDRATSHFESAQRLADSDDEALQEALERLRQELSQPA